MHVHPYGQHLLHSYRIHHLAPITTPSHNHEPFDVLASGSCFSSSGAPSMQILNLPSFLIPISSVPHWAHVGCPRPSPQRSLRSAMYPKSTIDRDSSHLQQNRGVSCASYPSLMVFKHDLRSTQKAVEKKVDTILRSVASTGRTAAKRAARRSWGPFSEKNARSTEHMNHAHERLVYGIYAGAGWCRKSHWEAIVVFLSWTTMPGQV